jgi:hypothetical protein
MHVSSRVVLCLWGGFSLITAVSSALVQTGGGRFSGSDLLDRKIGFENMQKFDITALERNTKFKKEFSKLFETESLSSTDVKKLKELISREVRVSMDDWHPEVLNRLYLQLEAIEKSALKRAAAVSESGKKRPDPKPTSVDDPSVINRQRSIEDLFALADRADKGKRDILNQAKVIGNEGRIPVGLFVPVGGVFPETSIKVPASFDHAKSAVVALLYAPPGEVGAPVKVTAEPTLIASKPPCAVGPNSINKYAETLGSKEFVGTGFVCMRTDTVITAGHVIESIKNRVFKDFGFTGESYLRYIRVVKDYSPNMGQVPPGKYRNVQRAAFLGPQASGPAKDVGYIVLDQAFGTDVIPLKVPRKNEDISTTFSFGYPFGWSLAVVRPEPSWNRAGFEQANPNRSPSQLARDFGGNELVTSLSTNSGQSGSPILVAK